ncbi:MAG: primary-amine oxidase [Quadrisphaera sp.]
MTATTTPTTTPVATASMMLSADEVDAARALLVEVGLLTPSVRVAHLGLDEPTRAEARAAAAGDAPRQRRLRVLLLDLRDGASTEVVLAVPGPGGAGRVLSQRTVDVAVEGQPPVLEEEFELIEEVLAADERWQRALAARGLTDAVVRVAPLSAGVFDYPDETGRRLLRGLAFVQEHPGDHAWAHPVDGLVGFVDVLAHEVVAVHDLGPVPVPAGSGNFDDPAVHGPLRTTLRPVEITQPHGPSFTVDEQHALTWEGWSLRVGFDAREGLVLHDVAFDDRDRGERRQVLHRAAIAEMVVPYGDPHSSRSWTNYFDTGEYLVGRSANSLELGCDCLGEITYLDAVVSDGVGRPRTIRNAVCLHEEDAGVLWKHTDDWAGSAHVRRQRRMVLSFFTTVGNYDYGFYWYLYLDGTVEFEAKATGIVFTAADLGDHTYASPLAADLVAPFHQHLFCARLDVAVDGPRNTVVEQQVERVPLGEGNPHGNAFRRTRRPLRSEAEAQRTADASLGRVWAVTNAERTNAVGEPVSYVLLPQQQPVLLAADDSSIARRATFATKQLWVTQYDPAQRYPAGEHVNQHPGHAGLPAYVAEDRDLEQQELVVWHSFGLTHFPRTEDWPIMPVDRIGFTLKPHGFFDRNPTLDVPPSASRHCGG